jgi:transcriptional regulator with XRE-family HTH domain
MRATPKKAGRRPAPGSRFLSDVLADNVRAYRSLRRLSQEELARRMVAARHPWTRATVSDIERANRNVTIDELLTLAMIVDSPIGDLLDPAGVDGRGTVQLDFGGWRPMPVGMASRWVRGRIRIGRTPEGVQVSPVDGFDPLAEQAAARDALEKALEQPAAEREEGSA